MNITHIFPTNDDVHDHNKVVFENSTSLKARIKAIDIIIGDVSDAVKEKIKEGIPTDSSKKMALFSFVEIAEGMKCDLTLN